MVGWIVHTLIVGAAVAGAAHLAAGALCPRGGRRRWIWAGAIPVALLLAVPWRPALLLPAETGALANSVAGALEPLSLVGVTSAGGAEGGSTGTPSAPGAGALLVAWGMLSLLLLAQRLGRHRGTRRALRGAPRRAVDGLELRVSEAAGPGVVGVWRPEIVVPRWVLDLPPEQRRWILRHESEHLEAGDALLVEAAALAAILVPWNLPLWYLRRRLEAAVELDCDARVLGASSFGARRAEGRAYGHLLISVASRGAPTGLALADRSHGTLTRRIKMITHSHEPRLLPRALALSVGAVLLLAGACMDPGDRGDALEITATGEADGPALASALDEGAQRADGLDEAPTFTPFTQAPEVQNRAELRELLEAAYPASLRDEGIGGTTVVHIFIDEEGRPGRVMVATPSGVDGLDAAALSVARRFDFTPARNEDEVVPVWIQIPVTFTPDAVEEG